MSRSRAASIDLPFMMGMTMLGGVTYLAWRSGALNLNNLLSAVGASTSNANVAPSAAVSASTPAPGRSPSDPRGVRNNNPANIVYSPSNNWQGQVGNDGTFAKFDSPRNGARAAFVLLKNYNKLYGITTIAQIAAKWAPTPVNNSAQYAANVANYSGIGQNVALNFNNANTMIAVLRGIIVAENGAAWKDYISQGDMLSAFAAS